MPRRPVRVPSTKPSWPLLSSMPWDQPQYLDIRAYSTSNRLTHIDEHGHASMVDVSDKRPTKRTATASGRIFIPEIAYNLITSSCQTSTQADKIIAKVRRKGDVLTVAQLAAIMGAKQTPNLIPLCHPLSLSKIDVDLRTERLKPTHFKNKGTILRHSILCTATVSCEGKTGVEMEALTAVSVGLLTVWDMLKAVAGQEMEIGEVMVTHKSGGLSGDFVRSN